MAAVAGHHDGICTASLDLFHLAVTVEDAFLIVARNQGTAATAAAELIHAGRVEVDPALDALIQDPTGLIKIAVSEYFLGAASVIAGIMVGNNSAEFRSI